MSAIEKRPSARQMRAPRWGRIFDPSVGTDVRQRCGALYTAFRTLNLIWRIGLRGRNKKVRAVPKLGIYIFRVFNYLYFFATGTRISPCYFQIGKRSCAPLARPQQFSCWPASVACVVVLSSRKPLKGLTVVPLRGGDRR